MSWLETRKIIRVGEKSYAVTLPKKWVELLGIAPGDSVDVIFDKSGFICIRPRKVEVSKPISPVIRLKARDCGNLIEKCIAGCYIEGHDVVSLESGPQDMLISTAPSKLPGLVVVEGEGNEVVIKIAISESIVGFDEVINRMVKVLEGMYGNVERLINTEDPSIGYEVLKGDDELDRLFFLGLRLTKRSLMTKLMEKDISTARELLDIALLLRSIEHVGDALDRSVRILQNMDFRPVREELLKLFKLSEKIVFDALYSYKRVNLRIISRILEMRRELRRRIMSLRKEASLALQGILNELDLIATIAEDIIDITISRYIRMLEKKPSE